MIVYSEGGTKAQEDEAEMILGVLSTIYPGHPWAVRVYDGGFFIRHLDFPSNWGMNCHYKNFGHDAAVLKRNIIMKAGEWLERANLKRGRSDESPIIRVEGVPEKDQPPSAKPPIIIDNVRAVRAAEGGSERAQEPPYV